MHIRVGILGAVLLASAILASEAGATEVEATSYSTWLAAASGAPAEWNMNVDSAGLVNEAAPRFQEGAEAKQTQFSGAASTDSPEAAPATPSAEFASAVTIGSGLLLFGARRKVFSNISVLRA